MGEEGIYCCAIYQFHQDSFRAAASRRVGLSAAHKASSLSVTRGRRPTRRPVAQALLLFIAAVLIDILGVLDQSMPALDCIYGPASTRVEINLRDAPSQYRSPGVTPDDRRDKLADNVTGERRAHEEAVQLEGRSSRRHGRGKCPRPGLDPDGDDHVVRLDVLVLERRGQAEEAGGQGQEARRPRGDARRLEASR